MYSVADVLEGDEMPSMKDKLLNVLFESRKQAYAGEGVSEFDHALQIADAAFDAGADEELVLASLLHDIGRSAIPAQEVSDTKEAVTVQGGARGHHDAGADFIAPWVPARVTWCVRNHVAAKRYLCTTDPEYLALLSGLNAANERGQKTSAAIWTMQYQGGNMSNEEIAEFRAHPWARDAISLRKWDDASKTPGKKTRGLQYWEPLLEKYFDKPPST